MKVIDEAKEYTRPVVLLFKLTDGEVKSSIGTFMHIDDRGHILSAKHIFTVGDQDPIVAFSCIFDRQYFSAEIIAEDNWNDLVLLKIKDYKPGSVKVLPKFFTSSVRPLSEGTQLVRLGYPIGNQFSHIAVTWDDAIKGFNWDAANTRLTCFANEGIFTQYEIDSKNNTHFLEISSPALVGQSGGPVLTAQGIIAGLQSKNSVFEIPGDNNLEVGIAASHVAIARLLEKHVPTTVNWCEHA